MRSQTLLRSIMFTMILLFANRLQAQSKIEDTVWQKTHKNIVRYNLSGALLFGFDKYVVFGYERVLTPRQSFSINIGGAGLPKFVSINTDSFKVQKDIKNSGFNASADYRFYLSKENKYYAPHGIYIGPYVSFNQFKRDDEWVFQEGSSAQKLITTETKFNIYTAGAELGYQFVFWNRLTLDMVLIGPGISGYDLKAKINGDLTEPQRENLQEALKQLLSQKFPGMNYVFADKELNANGVLNTTSIGFRYLIHIGFAF